MDPPSPLATAGSVPPTYSTRLWANKRTNTRMGTRISSAPERNFSPKLPQKRRNTRYHSLHSTNAPLHGPRLPPSARPHGRQRRPPSGLSPQTFFRRGAQRIHQPTAAARPPVQAAGGHA